jgi:TP901 family phage tail tape measure protein
MFTSGSPNSGQLQIGIALVLKDRFSNQAREASSQIRRLHNEAKVATNANLSAVRTMASAGAALGAGASMAMFGAIRHGAEFIDIMTQVGAIATEDTVKLKDLSDQAQSLGRQTMFTSLDIASGMQYFAMAGMSTKEIKANMGAVANLAAATRTQLGGKMGAADIMTNIMKMFRVESTEANAARISDVLTKAVTSANMSLLDMAESIKYAGTTVTNLGGSVEQTAAFIGVLGNAGLQGSLAGTAITNAYRYLSKSIGDPTYRGNKALTNLGLSKEDFMDAQGGLIDIGMAMQKIHEATRGMSDLDRFNTLISILGVRGERGGSVMIKAFDDYSNLLNRIQSESSGTAQGIMDERMGTIAGGIVKMTSALENIKTTFTESIAPVVTPFVNAVAIIFDGIRKIIQAPVIGKFISSLVLIGTVTLTIRLGFLALKATMKLMFNDSLVSLKNMFAAMMGGWKGANISALQYQATEAAIIAQRKAGIVSPGAAKAHHTVAYAATMRQNPGQWVGNAKAGKGNTFWIRDASGGVKRASASAAAQAAAAPMLGGGAKALAGFKGILKMGFALLGGPIGIGLTATALLLPAIISGLSRNRKATETNTNLINTQVQDQRRRDQEAKAKGGLSAEERMILMIEALDNLTSQLRQGTGSTFVVNLDGKEVIRKVVRETVREENLSLAGYKS